MYDHTGYGRYQQLAGNTNMLGLSMKGDNQDPWSADEMAHVLLEAKSAYPNATIDTSRMQGYAREILKVKSTLPTYNQEYGDTWIYGVASDPLKTAQFRALSRLSKKWKDKNTFGPESKGYHTFYRNLAMVGEHTWGLDHDTYLYDRAVYNNEDFDQVKNSSKYKYLEASWQEQREYLDKSISELSTDLKNESLESMSSIKGTIPTLADLKPSANAVLKTSNMTLKIDKNGCWTLLETKDGKKWMGTEPQQPLVYQTFDGNDFSRYYSQYFKFQYDGMDELPTALSKSKAVSKLWYPEKSSVFATKNSILVVTEFPTTASQDVGCPKTFYTKHDISPDGDSIWISVQWVGKRATKLPGAIWFSIFPSGLDSIRISKIGQYIDPKEVAMGGGRHLHGTDGKILLNKGKSTLVCTSLDAALVSPGSRSLIDFRNQLTEYNDGLHFNLYNNLWFTNYPAYYIEDASFRLNLQPNLV